MTYNYPKYNEPDWNNTILLNSPNVEFIKVEIDGVLPPCFHLSSVYPEYIKESGKWTLLENNIPFGVVVKRNEKIMTIEPARVLKNDLILCAEKDDGSQGIYVNKTPFDNLEKNFKVLPYDESGSDKYEKLVDILKYEKESPDGYIVWVLGPAVVFDYDTRVAMMELMELGFIDSILAGNAMATHDLEGGYLETALGQNIYTQESYPNGHYNHLDTINEARKLGSIEAFVESGEVKDGLIRKAVEMEMPYVLAGSIRDDGPLPPVYGDVLESIEEMEAELNKATLVISLATQLHSVCAASMTPSYKVIDNTLRPVFVYNIDISEYSVQSVSRVRDNYAVEGFLTNAQDFAFVLKKKLIK